MAARKFRANAMSEEKREERRTAGAKLRAELPPGPLPDTTPPTTSKLLARLMSRDGMTPGDRARKQARLREMRDALAAKENVSPENRGEAPSSRDSRVERLESPTIYMSQQEVTDEKHGGDASPSDMDLSATETAPVPAVPVVVPADAMSEADFTTPDAGPGAVVAVVGSDHLAGVEAKWDAFVRSGGTEGALSAAELDAILAAPETAKEDVGQRLAIMQRLLGLRCTESLVGDAMQALDDDLNKLVGDEIIAFNATSELYGSARMLLSCVEDEELREAVIGGFKCDMTEVLKPASDVRPSKGGIGWSEEAIVWLRTSSSVDLAPLSGGD